MYKAFLFVQRRFFLCLWSYFQLLDGFCVCFLLRLALFRELIETKIYLCRIVVFNVASWINDKKEDGLYEKVRLVLY